MTDVKFALFIEPNEHLRDLLMAAKKRVEAWRPGQVYCDHPPHCTLLVGVYAPPKDWLPALRLRLATCRPFSLHISKWLIFPDDLPAGGGQTVTMAPDPNPEIFLLQAAAAEVLAPHRIPVPHSWTIEPYATSQQRFGFPFVGAHWQPHFTVASLSTSLDDPFLVQLTSSVLDFRLPVQTVGVWAITNQGHARMETIPFGCAI